MPEQDADGPDQEMNMDREADKRQEQGLKRRFPDHFYSSVKCRLALASDFVLPID